MSLKLMLHALLPALDLRKEIEEWEPILVEVKRQEPDDDPEQRQRSQRRRLWRQRRAERQARASRRTSRSPMSLW